MKLGVIIGEFLPLHNGSLTLCKVAQTLSDNLVIIIKSSQNDLIPLKLRINWLKQEFPKAIIKNISKEKLFLGEDPLNFIFSNISKTVLNCKFHFYSSDTSTVNIAKKMNNEYTILDPNRLAQNISSKSLISDPYSQWFDLPFSVRLSLMKRVVLIGPESVGKSTLAEKIKTSFSPQPFLPEYGRPYEIFRAPGPYQDKEFETIASVHAAHRKALLPFSGPIFIEDTDELATAVWVEMLMQKKLLSIEMQIKLPCLYLLMDPSVPFTSEKTRYFDKQKRKQFFVKIKSKLDQYNAHYQILTGSWIEREIEAKEVINSLLSKKIDWSQLS